MTGCHLCCDRTQAVTTGFVAGRVSFPTGEEIRPPGTWLLCGRCTSDIVRGDVLAPARRFAEQLRRFTPELAMVLNDYEQMVFATAVIYGFHEAHAGRPIIPLDPEPNIPEDASPQVREGLARRAIVAAGGPCPCGARTSIPNRRERRRAERAGEPSISAIRHRTDCPADPRHLEPALAAWSAAG